MKTQITETMNLSDMFKELDFDLTSGITDKNKNKLALVSGTTHNDVTFEIVMLKERLADADINRALKALSFL